ncbi:MAG: hypothetical protein Q8L28_01215 [bacterium]|nr:hypothetical protein [bacterium]
MSDSKVLGFLKQSCTGMTTAELKAKCEEEGIKNWLSELKRLKDEEIVKIKHRLSAPALLKCTEKAWPGKSLKLS